MTANALIGGFADAPVQSAHAFRAALDALSRPGLICAAHGAAPPAPLSVAAGVLILTLCDSTTPVYLAGAHDCDAVRAWIRFHCGAPLVKAAAASFAVGSWQALAPISQFSIGTPDYPDRSATLFVEMTGLSANGTRLVGPGIKDATHLSLPETAAFQGNRARFPMGFDCFFTAGAQMAALPRSTYAEDI